MPRRRRSWTPRPAFSALLAVAALATVVAPPFASVGAAPLALSPRQGGGIPPAVAAARQQIAVLFQQGQEALRKRDYSRAEQALLAAAEIAEGVGDRYSLGVMMDGLAGVYAARGDVREAIETYSYAVAHLRQAGDPKALARALNNAGETFRGAGQPEKAIACLEEAVNLWVGLGDAPGAAWGLITLGAVYQTAGHFEKAVAALRQAITIREETKAGPRALAIAHLELGRVYHELARYGDARSAYDLGLRLAQAADSPDVYASVLTAFGDVLSAEGRLEEAASAHREALALREGGEDPEAVARSLGNLAGVSYLAGRHDWSLFYSRRALDIAAKTGSKRLTAGQSVNLALALAALGQRDRAADSLVKGLALYEEMDDPEGIATAAFNLSGLLLRDGEPAAAVALLERLLPGIEKRGDAGFAADIRAALGQALGTLGRADAALENIRVAHAHFERMGDPRRLGRSFNDLGTAYARLGKTDEAAQAFERALALKKRAGGPADTAVTQANLAAVYVRQNQWEKAAALLEEAVVHVERLRDQVAEPDRIGALQEAGSGPGGDIYARHAAVLAHLGRAGEALAQVERGRGQGLARQAAQARTNWEGVVPGVDARNLAEAAKALRQADAWDRSAAEQANRLEAEGADQESVASARQAAEAARRAREEAQQALTSIRNDVAARRPAFRALCGLDAPTSEEFLALARANPDTLYLTWSVAPEGALLLALHHGVGVKAYPVPLPRRELSARVAAWREAVAPEGGGPGTDAAAELQAARALYDALIGPAEKDGLLGVPGVKRLVVIGDGPLRELPFAALAGADGKRLVERFPISTGVSLRLLAPPPAPPAGGEGAATPARPVGRGILCVADPGGGAAAKAESDLLSGFAPLPAARQEGAAVARLFGDAATGLVGDAATKDAILPRLEGARLLHFATHGLLDDRDGLRSGLLLAPPPAAPKDEEDGAPLELPLLTAGEILARPLAAELTVLSACDTGRGESGGGDGLLGLVWAFRAAGCPSIVASQWSVDDVATGALMVRFYEGIRAGKRKDDALRDAMLSVAGAPGGATAAPYFWAAFQLNGDAGPLGAGASGGDADEPAPSGR
jgi:Uncharacterized protein conserved in bacteria